MKKLLIALALVSTTSFAAVVKSTDSVNQCSLYQVIPNDENGGYTMSEGQILVSPRSIYGLAFESMEVDFDQRKVMVQPMMNIVLGINKPLLPFKVSIHEQNPNFNFLINQLNRKIYAFEKVCIDNKNEVIYAEFFPTEER